MVQEADRDQDHLQDLNLAPGLNQGQDQSQNLAQNQDQHLQLVLKINYVMRVMTKCYFNKDSNVRKCKICKHFCRCK